MKKNNYIVWTIIGLFVAIQLVLLAVALPKYDAKPSTNNNLSSSLASTFVRAKVESISNQTDAGGGITQRLSVVFLEGDEKTQRADVNYSIAPLSVQSRQLVQGDQIILSRSTTASNKINYTVQDKYRLDTILFIAVLFGIVLFLIAGLRGLGAIISLCASVATLFLYVIPQLIAGQNVVLVSAIATVIIGTISMFLSHGWNNRARLAWVAMIIVLVSAINAAIWAVEAVKISGLSSDDAAYLQFSSFGSINFVGVVIASVIIASIGVLDDVTSSQAAVVDELNKANPGFSMWELFARSMSVGREHIASMVNSLILVYLGTSFTSFLVLFGGQQYPWNIALNLEKISTEIVSSLVVSLVLTLAVPVTTFIVAINLKKNNWGKPKISFPRLSLTKR